MTTPVTTLAIGFAIVLVVVLAAGATVLRRQRIRAELTSLDWRIDATQLEFNQIAAVCNDTAHTAQSCSLL